MRRSLIALSLVAGLANSMIVPPALAAGDDTPPPAAENQEAEKTWIQSLKTQVEVARANVELLGALTVFYVRKGGEEAIESLDNAKENLAAAYRTADEATRTRIIELGKRIDETKDSIRSGSEQAGERLQRLAHESEEVLSSTVAETQAKAGAVQDELATRLALAQARVEALNARVALEVEQAPDKARNALEKAEQYLDEAMASATEQTRQMIADLRVEAGAAREALASNIEDAKAKVDALATNTETTLNAYAERIEESEEAALLRRRYAQLQAQAALLKAGIAAEAEATEEQARSDLEEAKAWFGRARTDAEEAADAVLADMEDAVEIAMTELNEQEQQARNSIAALLERAAELVKNEE